MDSSRAIGSLAPSSGTLPVTAFDTFSDCTVSLMLDTPNHNVEYPAMAQSTGELFEALPTRDLYWQALVLLCNGHKDAAQQIADEICTNASCVTPFSAWKMDPPPTLADAFDRLFISDVVRDPQGLSYTGLFESIGLKTHNAFLSDRSIAAGQADLNDVKANIKILKAYTASPGQRTSLNACLWTLQNIAAGEPFLLYTYPVTQMGGVLRDLTMLFTLFHTLDTQEDCENYLARLKQIPWQFRHVSERLETQRANGIVPPRFAIEKQIQSIDSFLDGENPFYRHLRECSSDAQFVARAKQIIDTIVAPAYRSFQNNLRHLLSCANANNGVWALPNGDAYYAYMLQRNTTTQLTADQIHALGLQEVKRTEEAIRALLMKEKIDDPNKDVGELLRAIAEDPRFYYPDTEEGKKACLAEYKAIIERAHAELGPLFDLKPSSPVRVVAVPKHEENGAALAYYCPPSMNGTRPGVFYVNLRSMREHSKFRMQTIAVHEAEPGHHFQQSLQFAMDLPMTLKYRHGNSRIPDNNAYIEGWALYAEKLAFEQGFYSTTFDQLGHLQDELFRAVRLVVDTGIHHEHWSREEAIDYMMKKLGYPQEGVAAEVERYFVMPGQACSYKIGQMKLLSLRKQAQECLGAAFDIREFHNVILKTAAVPLDVLEAEVERYIQSKGVSVP